MGQFKKVCGIDTSKSTLDLCMLDGQQIRYWTISNTRGEIQAWLNEHFDENLLVVVEQTGSYSDQVVDLAYKMGLKVSLVNGQQSSFYMKFQGVDNKNDKQAAYCLASMGQTIKLSLYEPCSESMQERKQLLSTLETLNKQKQAINNQLHALSYKVHVSSKVVEVLEQTKMTLEEQIQVLEKELGSLEDEDFDEEHQRLTSVIGIGAKTARELLVVTGGLSNFEHARQLAKFIGITPSTHCSGSSVRYRGRITKKGSARLRGCLYMGATSARKHNKACKALYERLRKRGKCHKQAQVAVMHKLIRQAFAVVKHNCLFDNDYETKAA